MNGSVRTSVRLSFCLTFLECVCDSYFIFLSCSSSFVIEFKEDSQQLQVTGSQKDSLLDPEGCFSRDLLHNRDDLSMSSSCSESTEDRNQERRGGYLSLLSSLTSPKFDHTPLML